MEFNKKLQELRRQKGMTQEELAEKIYVSRTAVSKWESGRGYPNIESLKALSKFYSVSIDDLLSGEELITIAEEDSNGKQQSLRKLIFGLMDLCAALFFFLPLFADRTADEIGAVSLLSLNCVRPYLRAVYFFIVTFIILTGLLQLVFQNCDRLFWQKHCCTFSLVMNLIGTLIFILSLQPYAAVFLFIFIAIKILILTKQR